MSPDLQALIGGAFSLVALVVFGYARARREYPGALAFTAALVWPVFVLVWCVFALASVSVRLWTPKDPAPVELPPEIPKAVARVVPRICDYCKRPECAGFLKEELCSRAGWAR